ncbi:MULTISPECIES: CBS domain-containing protein [Catenuloplanes]|uniref:CBS domain-containing protein n=1 Tax=Catenuloplanes niger TaxID=587534 RepID=A0AAE3ZRR6_9ACTN|nr:CBS domain-containing protein [Catenuloplanes niger]MDR7323585.1 CBS domain-containing protein [Catenuloplanes niger]
MTRDVVYLPADTTLDDAAQAAVRRLLIRDPDRQPMGIVARGDLVSSL